MQQRRLFYGYLFHYQHLLFVSDVPAIHSDHHQYDKKSKQRYVYKCHDHRHDLYHYRYIMGHYLQWSAADFHSDPKDYLCFLLFVIGHSDILLVWISRVQAEFCILQIFYQNLPLICIGITLSSLQNFLFNIKFEQEREISNAKIYSLTRLFIISYYVDLQTGEWQYVNTRGIKYSRRSQLSADALKHFNDAIQIYANHYVHEDI